MSESVSWYEKLKIKELESNKERIAQVLKADTWEFQTVLALKSCCSALEDEQHFTFHGDNGNSKVFGFNEVLVNRLMLLAYLYGSKDIDQKSFDRGYYSCRKDFAEDLKSLYDKYGVDND